MTVAADEPDLMPVVSRMEDFDRASGNALERTVFNNRLAVVLVCLLASLVLGYFAATRLVLNASFEKMVPQSHPFIQNYFDNRNDLRGLGNAIRVVVENRDGDIFDAQYLKTLQQISDDLILTAGVDRAGVKSLWTPSVRWVEVTEEGFQGDSVISDKYDGSPEAIDQLRQNIAKSSTAQTLVASDQRSSMLFIPLLEKDPLTGQRLDYRTFSHRLEEGIRAKYENAGVRIYIVGFAKLVGDLMDGLAQMGFYFAAAAVIACLIILFYTHCMRSTLLVVGCSVIAVLWQVGVVCALGMEMDPFSVLVPFLVFAIGVSHGAQKMNGIMQDVGRGTHRQVAARYTFRRLFVAGVTALLADAVGFAVLMVIDIPVIRDMALAASIGVAVLIFTNLLLPVLLSYVGVSPRAAARSLREDSEASHGKGLGKLWFWLDRFTERRWALVTTLIFVLISVVGFLVSLQLKVGDLDPGAPELRADSRYNRDNAYITQHYALSSDQFAVIVKTPVDGCLKYETLVQADNLAWTLKNIPGVQTAVSIADSIRVVTAGTYDGSAKWLTISRNQETANFAGNQSLVNNPDLANKECSVMPVIAYLSDHKAETLDRVVQATTEFASKNNEPDRQFLLAAGSSGIEAATNIVVKSANRTMLVYVYAAVTLLCFVAFRSWRAVLVAILPLMMTSILCEALMVMLGMGVKVATLPVIALGVGIGVDYALYLVSVQLSYQRRGHSLADAYRQAVQFTGRIVALVGFTLGAGVVTWVWSPIKFQADMGILLTFMFVLNMLGALILVPALSHFLLPSETRTRRDANIQVAPKQELAI